MSRSETPLYNAKIKHTLLSTYPIASIDGCRDTAKPYQAVVPRFIDVARYARCRISYGRYCWVRPSADHNGLAPNPTLDGFDETQETLVLTFVSSRTVSAKEGLLDGSVRQRSSIHSAMYCDSNLHFHVCSRSDSSSLSLGEMARKSSRDSAHAQQSARRC